MLRLKDLRLLWIFCCIFFWGFWRIYIGFDSEDAIWSWNDDLVWTSYEDFRSHFDPIIFCVPSSSAIVSRRSTDGGSVLSPKVPFKILVKGILLANLNLSHGFFSWLSLNIYWDCTPKRSESSPVIDEILPCVLIFLLLFPSILDVIWLRRRYS